MKENISKLIKNIKSTGKKLDIPLVDDYAIFEKGKIYLFGLNSVFVLKTNIECDFNFSFKREDILLIKEKNAEYFITSITEDNITVLREIKVKKDKKEFEYKTKEIQIPINKTTYKFPKIIESLNFEVTLNMDLVELASNLESQESLIELSGRDDKIFLKLGEDEACLSDILHCEILKIGECDIKLIPKTIINLYKIIGVTKKNPNGIISFNSEFIRFSGDNIEYYVLASK